MDAKISSPVCSSHIGQRPNHEDNFLFNGNYLTPDMQKNMENHSGVFLTGNPNSPVTLFAVSDGMGGHNAGEVASRICVEKLAILEKQIQHCLSVKEAVSAIQSCIGEINSIVCHESRRNDELKGMGATLVILVVCGNESAILNIGDSRAYFFSNNNLIQITKDNTEGQRLLDLGLLTRKELISFPARKNLSRYIGYSQAGFVLQADEYYPDLGDGVLLLCSDGISDGLSDSQIENILSTEKDLELAGRRLINEAIAAHNADNTTAILIPLRR